MSVASVRDGELRDELEAGAEALGLAGAVVFAGWRRDLASVYADLDTVVISSHNEGTPASLIEAMATGCPVIATSVGGVPDLIVDEETGRLVPPGDRDQDRKLQGPVHLSAALPQADNAAGCG